MKSKQGRILLIGTLLSLGLSLLAMRLSTKVHQHLQSPSDSKIKRKSFAPAAELSPFQVQWRIVIAKGSKNQKPLQALDCTELDSASTSFLTQLTRRYPGITFTSPASGKRAIPAIGGWYPSMSYPFFHPELKTLHGAFPVAAVFIPDKTVPNSDILMVRQWRGDFDLIINEFFSPSLRGVKTVKTSPLFQPTQLPQRQDVSRLVVGQTILFASFSGYFEKDGKKLKPLDTHMLFCKVERR